LTPYAEDVQMLVHGKWRMAAAVVDGGGGGGRTVMYAALDPGVPTFQAAKVLRGIAAAGLA
jgi:hypothetical protein